MVTGLKENPANKPIGKHYNSGRYEDVFDAVVVTTDHKIINRSNYEEELNNLINEMDERRQEVFGGSGWRMLKFFSLSYDIYENKASRSGTYIKTPENIAIQNVDLSIYRIKIINVLCGV